MFFSDFLVTFTLNSLDLVLGDNVLTSKVFILFSL